AHDDACGERPDEALRGADGREPQLDHGRRHRHVRGVHGPGRRRRQARAQARLHRRPGARRPRHRPGQVPAPDQPDPQPGAGGPGAARPGLTPVPPAPDAGRAPSPRRPSSRRRASARVTVPTRCGRNVATARGTPGSVRSERPPTAGPAPGRPAPGGAMPIVATRVRASVVVSYVAFALTGVSASVGAVVLPAQIVDYRVDRATIGLTFFTFSAAFFLAGATTGWLMERLGTRRALVVGSVAYVAGVLAVASRPSFAVLVALQLLTGYGTGIVESVLQAHLAGLPAQTARLNLLHGFFGVGALVGPLLA